MTSQNNQKEWVGRKAGEWVLDGMVIGLGTGSTAYYFILEVARKIKEEGMHIHALASSNATHTLARELEIPLITLEDCEHIDLYVDGADEIDPQKNLIKGRGGAMVQEKILAANSREFIVIADGSKMVPKLGSVFPVPVEVVPMAKATVLRQLKQLGGYPEIRMMPDLSRPVKTDQGNIILDTRFDPSHNFSILDREINYIPGVLGHGIFIDLATRIVTLENNKLKVID